MRIKIEVEVNTDQVPGWGYYPSDFVNLIQNYLERVVPHYKPETHLVEATNEEWLRRNST